MIHAKTKTIRNVTISNARAIRSKAAADNRVVAGSRSPASSNRAARTNPAREASTADRVAKVVSMEANKAVTANN